MPKWFDKLFRRGKKQNLIMTAEEAYAQVPEEPGVLDPVPAADDAMIDSAPEPETVPPPAPEAAPAADEIAQTPRAQRATLALYACVEDADYAYAMVRDCFDQVPGGSQDAPKQFVLRAPGGLTMRVSVDTGAKVRDESAPRLAARFSARPVADADVMHAALMQIGLFNTEVTAQIDALPESVEVALYIDRLYRAAEKLRGFVLTGEGKLYRWDGRLLLSEDGRTDFMEFMPVMCQKPKPKTPPKTAADDRRAETLTYLQTLGAPAPQKPPKKLDETDCALKPADEIINRLAAVFTCALQAHAYSSPREVAAPTTWMTAALIRLNNQFSVSRLFTPRENEYILRHRAELDEMYLSKYECCAVMLWALGLMELSSPGDKCDRSRVLSIMRGADTDMLYRIAKPKSIHEVLSLHDITCCLHRACVDAQMRGESLLHVDADVMYERHYALNWLLAVDKESDWDRIIPNA